MPGCRDTVLLCYQDTKIEWLIWPLMPTLTSVRKNVPIFFDKIKYRNQNFIANRWRSFSNLCTRFFAAVITTDIRTFQPIKIIGYLVSAPLLITYEISYHYFFWRWQTYQRINSELRRASQYPSTTNFCLNLNNIRTR